METVTNLITIDAEIVEEDLKLDWVQGYDQAMRDVLDAWRETNNEDSDAVDTLEQWNDFMVNVAQELGV